MGLDGLVRWDGVGVDGDSLCGVVGLGMEGLGWSDLGGVGGLKAHRVR